MYKSTVLTLLVVIASVFPSALAFEINADSLKRSLSPLLPDRRDNAKRNGFVEGVVEVRDKDGKEILGYVSREYWSDAYKADIFGVVDPKDKDDRLQVEFDYDDYNLEIECGKDDEDNYYKDTDNEKKCIGPWLQSYDKDVCFPLVIIECPAKGPWSFNSQTYELTITLPGPKGAPYPGVFEWDKYLNKLYVVKEYKDNDYNQKPVRLFLVKCD